MKTKSILVACAVYAAALITRADAAISFSLFDSFGDPFSVTLSPGDSFTLRLEVTSSAELLTGLSYNLEGFGLATSQFRITARSLGTSPFSDLTTGDAIALQASSALLDPTNDTDLGATLADVFSPVGPGTLVVADYTVQALPTISPFDTYSIGTDIGMASDDAFAEQPIADATYSVVVVPEPSAFGFAAAGLGMLLGRRKRRT